MGFPRLRGKPAQVPEPAIKSGFSRPDVREYIDQPGLMPGGAQKTDQVIGLQRHRHVIDQRMAMDRASAHDAAVDEDPDLGARVVDDGEGRDRARQHAEIFHQPFGAAERELAGADDGGQRFQIDPAVLLRHHQEHRLAPVAHEQVLDVMARQLAAQLLGICHREQRRMSHDVMRDTKRGQPIDQLLRRRGEEALVHGGGRVAKPLNCATALRAVPPHCVRTF
jgi:hypothetical protein